MHVQMNLSGVQFQAEVAVVRGSLRLQTLEPAVVSVTALFTGSALAITPAPVATCSSSEHCAHSSALHTQRQIFPRQCLALEEASPQRFALHVVGQCYTLPWPWQCLLDEASRLTVCTAPEVRGDGSRQRRAPRTRTLRCR